MIDLILSFAALIVGLIGAYICIKQVFLAIREINYIKSLLNESEEETDD